MPKESSMRAEDLDKQALALFAAELFLETGNELNASEALHEFIKKYRPDLIAKAEKLPAPKKSKK